jgi:phenylacetate-coenzyme A ligase PaaK-like adenylate-forming protein
MEVARWLAETKAAGRPAVLDTTASSGVRVSVAARDHGLDIAGTLFRFGGEPLTEAKAKAVAASGSRAVCNYSMGELGRAGVACGQPAALDDVHLVTDKLAVIQREREVGVDSTRVGALLITTLVPSCPKLMLNVETDDYGVLEQRDCGCALGEVGFSVHLHGIRSYEKLTSEGMNFLGPELLSVIEQVLPARFGGSSTDYQLVEEEVDGLPKVAIVVSPRIGQVDEAEVVRTVLEALGQGPSHRGMMAEVWRAGETLRVLRRDPYTTVTAKILPLHVLPRR